MIKREKWIIEQSLKLMVNKFHNTRKSHIDLCKMEYISEYVFRLLYFREGWIIFYFYLKKNEIWTQNYGTINQYQSIAIVFR